MIRLPAPIFSAMDEFFSDEAIIRRLCLERAKVADKERERLRLQTIAKADSTRRLGKRQKMLLGMFPPRRLWKRPHWRREMRGRDLTAWMLFQTVMGMWDTPEARSTRWHISLRRMVNGIRRRALNGTGYVFTRPQVVSHEKDRAKAEYRAIACYGLVDSVVQPLTTEYLQTCFDPDLLDCSCAYRLGSKGRPAPKHHDVLRAIVQFLEQSRGRELWVGECDIRKFFDCLHHDVARAALQKAVWRAEARGVRVDPRALAIVSAYLDSYSFPREVLGIALPKLRTMDPAGTFSWPGLDGGLNEFYPDPSKEDIGIPQGGAISGMIANLVLHHADEAVTQGGPDERRFYKRYSDDIILIHSDRRACEEGMARYFAALKELRLPVHPVRPEIPYGRQFWGQKSKGPYRWTDHPGGVPWVGFVGYQVHYDGHIRVRPSSLRKHRERLWGEVEQVMVQLLLAQNWSETRGETLVVRTKRIMASMRNRMAAIGVGVAKQQSAYSRVPGHCWVGGFQLLAEFPHQRGQLRSLDRARELNLCKLSRWIGRFSTEARSVEDADRARRLKHDRRSYQRSYVGHFRRELSLCRSRWWEAQRPKRITGKGGGK